MPLVLLGVAFFGTYPVAVAWHRFGLAGERPTLLPADLGLALDYFWRVLLVFVVTVFFAILLILPLLIVLDRGPDGFSMNIGSLPEPATTKNILLGTAYAALVTAIGLRYSMILPATALGRKLRLNESRALVKDAVGFAPLLILGLFLHLAPIALDLLFAKLPMSGTATLILLPLPILFWFMFSIALLTTLYARCVETRPLA